MSLSQTPIPCRGKWWLRWILCLLILLPAASPRSQVVMSMAYRMAIRHGASGTGACGTFTFQQSLHLSTGGSTSSTTQSGATTGAILYVIHVASSNAVVTVTSSDGDSIHLAGSIVGPPGLLDQIYYCTNPITSASTSFTVTSGTACFPVIQVDTFTGPAGAIAIVDAQVGNGSSSSSTFNPGTLSAFSGTELFVSGVCSIDGLSSISSGWSTPIFDTQTPISGGLSYTNCSTSASPTWTMTGTDAGSTEMVMFGMYNCSAGDTIWLTLGTPGTPRSNFDGTVGCKFTQNTTVTVTSLGSYVFSGSTQSHQIGIWNSGFTLLGSVTLNKTGLGTGMAFVSCTPFTLTAGQTYYIGEQEFNGGDSFYNEDVTVTTTGVASIVTSSFASGGVFDTPDSSGSFVTSFVPVNFKYH